jgi:hypothetical protein
MTAARYTMSIGILVLVCGATAQAGQAADAPRVAAHLTPDEQEVFLRDAHLTRARTLGTGITASRRATLTHGDLTHDAHIQTVNIYRPVFEAGRSTEIDFRDTYRYNIAAYRLARVIGLTNVPASIERTFERSPAAYTWWVDDVMMDEGDRASAGDSGPDPVRFRQQVQVMHVFDELIQNRDRNHGNVLWTSDWTLWMIDHTRAFRTGRDLLRPERLVQCDRALLQQLRELTSEGLREMMGRILNRRELDAVLARRALIVARYDARIAELGEDAVLFALRPATMAGVESPVH